MGRLDHDDGVRRHYCEAKHFGGNIAAIKDQSLRTIVQIDVGIAGPNYESEEAYKTHPIGLPFPKEDSIELRGAMYNKGILRRFRAFIRRSVTT